MTADESLEAKLARFPAECPAATAADDLVVLQYTSGTTLELHEERTRP